MSNVDKFKAISIRLKDELGDIDGQIVNVQQQLNELKEQRNKKLEEIAFNDYNIQNIIHHESPSLGFLSFDSIKLLLSYLAQHKHQNLYCINKHFRSYKLATYYYKLTKAKSIDFYFNQNGFRDNLLKSVVNPSQQISLQFVNNSHVSDTKCLADVHSLVIKGCTKVKDISPLGNIHYLDLTGTKGFKNISALTSVNTLILDDCSSSIRSLGNLSNVRVFHLSKNKHISDLSSLANCEELVISNCINIKDISNLKNVKKLKLSHTNVISFNGLNITDVNVLELFKCPCRFDVDLIKTTLQDFKNMKQIQIRHCNSIEEIKNLNNVDNVTISCCSSLTKIDMISDAKEVTIEGCSNLATITSIKNIQGRLLISNIQDCYPQPNITISGINNVDSLTLSNIRPSISISIETISGVSNVHVESVRFSDFSFLIGNPLIKLEFTDCPSLVDISYLGFCPDVTLTNCDGVLDVSGLVGCHRVEIRNCRGVTDVSALGNVHELTIEYPYFPWSAANQYHVTGVSSLGKVHTLALSGLDITDADIATLGTVNTLDITTCQNIVDVSPLVTVKKLTLKRNKKVADVSMLHGKVKSFTHQEWPNYYG